MESRNQSSSDSLNYLLFASVMMLVLIALSGSAFSARAKSPKEVANPSSNSMAVTSVPATPQTQRRRPISQLESELVTISRRGFEPREMTRPAGAFLLLLENRSGLRAIFLQLKGENGQVVREARLTREDSDWNSVVTLPAGRYLLTEANHPRWSCAITITQ